MLTAVMPTFNKRGKRNNLMGFTEEDIEKMSKKLKELKSLMELQFEMGEDTTVVSGKIRELERILGK